MSHQKRRKTVVIGLDGVPYSLIKKLAQQGTCPNLSGLLQTGSLFEIKSAHPAVSSVAWTTFITGKNPAKHGIFGFSEKIPNTYDVFFPNYRHIMAKPIWEILENYNKRSVVINVPSTYPASALNGILIAGFVAIDLERAVFPKSFVPLLKKMGYKIDVETQLIYKSREKLFEDLFLTLEKRKQAMLHFIKNEIWDIFIGVFTETDRLQHVFWESIEENDAAYSHLCREYYKILDGAVGKIVECLDNDTAFLLLSDHGFCKLKQEVYINTWFMDAGFLHFNTSPPKSLYTIGEGSKVYCMDPGRIYINLKGRERDGNVGTGTEYEKLRNRLISGLTELKAPLLNTNTINTIHRREDIYHGKYFDMAPDLIIEPKHGFDPKGGVNKKEIFCNSIFSGMHTYDDAFVYVNNKHVTRKPLTIADVTAALLSSLHIPVPEDFDGINFVEWN